MRAEPSSSDSGELLGDSQIRDVRTRLSERPGKCPAAAGVILGRGTILVILFESGWRAATPRPRLKIFERIWVTAAR